MDKIKVKCKCGTMAFPGHKCPACSSIVPMPKPITIEEPEEIIIDTEPLDYDLEYEDDNDREQDGDSDGDYTD